MCIYIYFCITIYIYTGMRVSADDRGIYMRVYTFILKYLLSEARSWEELSIVGDRAG